VDREHECFVHELPFLPERRRADGTECSHRIVQVGRQQDPAKQSGTLLAEASDNPMVEAVDGVAMGRRTGVEHREQGAVVRAGQALDLYPDVVILGVQYLLGRGGLPVGIRPAEPPRVNDGVTPGSSARGGPDDPVQRRMIELDAVVSSITARRARPRVFVRITDVRWAMTWVRRMAHKSSPA
jgi:hypothetical protein